MYSSNPLRSLELPFSTAPVGLRGGGDVRAFLRRPRSFFFFAALAQLSLCSFFSSGRYHGCASHTTARGNVRAVSRSGVFRGRRGLQAVQLRGCCHGMGDGKLRCDREGEGRAAGSSPRLKFSRVNIRNRSFLFSSSGKESKTT